MTDTTPQTAAGTAALRIVNQIDAEFGAALRALPQSPEVIDHLDTDAPWDMPGAAQVLITRAMPAWRRAPATGPDLPALGWVQTFSAGVEIYPDWLLSGRQVSCGRGLTSAQIAEYVLAAMLGAEKNLDALRATSPATWTDSLPIGTLQGKTLGLIGFGAIGQDIATRARAFGMRILALRRGDWPSPPEGIRAARDLTEVMAAADHLVLATPLTPETAGMIGATALAGAKPGQHLINISRGGVLDQEALIAALDAGTLSRATLDVTTPEPLPEGHPLWTHPKVFLTPHISYKGGSERGDFLDKVARNLTAYLAGAPLTDAVDPARGY